MRLAVRLGTEPDWRRQVRDHIRATSGVLYENAAWLRELEDFFRRAVANGSGGADVR